MRASLSLRFKGDAYPTRGRASLRHEGHSNLLSDVDLADRPSGDVFCADACRALNNLDASEVIDNLLERELIRAERLIPVPSAKLVERYPQLRPAVIDGLLRVGEVTNVVTSSKASKTGLVNAFAVSVAAGREWIDMLKTERCPVQIVDNELHREARSACSAYPPRCASTWATWATIYMY